MMPHNDPHFDISLLLAKLIEGTISPGERAQLEAWRQESRANDALFCRITDPAYMEEQLDSWEDGSRPRVRELLLMRIKRRRAGKMRTLRRYAAAAMILLLLGSGTAYLLQHDSPSAALSPAAHRLNDLPVPGGVAAKLVMGNGNEVMLQGNGKQEFEEKDGTHVRNKDSVLQYNSSCEAAATPVYHTLETPRRGEYAVVLADGTRVWLNAASSLRFPTHFNGTERVVELSGEAYFEVSGDARRPFIVKTSCSRIRVLGTSFNVNAYTDMPGERTTLASGAVNVAPAKDGPGVVLRPGYQATVQQGAAVKVARADIEEALAWKNGLFIFNAASLGDILQQLKHWYDVDIKCESGIAQQLHFTGRINRYENIAGVLELLEMTGKIKFMPEGRTFSVIPAKAGKH